MPHVVIVAMTVDQDDPDEAVAFVRAELAAKLRSERQPWQGEAAHLPPHWQITGVQEVPRLDAQGEPAGGEAGGRGG